MQLPPPMAATESNWPNVIVDSFQPSVGQCGADGASDGSVAVSFLLINANG